MDVKKCATLQEVRDEVDKIDESLVKMIAHRKNYIKQAASFKESIEEIKADDRVNDVLSRARHHALSLGLSPNMITEIFTTMINDMVETEIEELRNAKNF
jgi:isochorismate pyruvate lyase